MYQVEPWAYTPINPHSSIRIPGKSAIERASSMHHVPQ